MGKFEYFTAKRRLPPDRGAGSATVERRLRLVDDVEKYASLAPFLRERAVSEALRVSEHLASRGIALRDHKQDPLASAKAAFAALLPDLRLVGVRGRDQGARIALQRRDTTAVDLDDLSDSEAQGVLFAVTFTQLDLHDSVVLIDTPELHQHPRAHTSFLQAIGELGQSNQIIAATTSAAILGAARPEQVIDLSEKR